jgi:hypothetical protein
MPASPAMSAPPISPGEMQLLLSRTGLVLNPGQVADLVLAWRQVAALIATIPHDRPLADDMAYAFRLSPPADVAASAAARAPRKAARSKAAKPKAKAKAKTRKKTAATPASPRKPARRGR